VTEKLKNRTIIFYKDYFQNFFLKQRDKVKDKIIWTFDQRPILNISKIQTDFLKSEYNKEVTFFGYSVFVDQGQLVVLANGFQKKTQKTPKQEIEKSLKIKEEYENEKK
jgi:hypothetical protein